MSRTYKKLPYGYFRETRNYHRLIKQDVKEEGEPRIRRGAIPPDPWDDIKVDDQAWIPQKICYRLLDEGATTEEAVKKIKKKFHIPAHRIREMIRWYEEAVLYFRRIRTKKRDSI